MPLYPPGSRFPSGNGSIERQCNDGGMGEFHDGRHTRQQPVGLGQVSSGARHAVLQLFGKLSHLLPGAPAFDDFLLELSVGHPQPSLRSAESSAPRTSSWLLGSSGGSSTAAAAMALPAFCPVKSCQVPARTRNVSLRWLYRRDAVFSAFPERFTRIAP